MRRLLQGHRSSRMDDSGWVRLRFLEGEDLAHQDEYDPEVFSQERQRAMFLSKYDLTLPRARNSEDEGYCNTGCCSHTHDHGLYKSRAFSGYFSCFDIGFCCSLRSASVYLHFWICHYIESLSNFHLLLSQGLEDHPGLCRHIYFICTVLS